MALIPRPAATVVLMDQSSRVYLTKRPKTMKFLAGFYVFPGGSVEIEDHIAENEYFINEESIESADCDSAHYVAAARELFEEVGVFLGCTADGSTLQFEKEKGMEYRRQLLNNEISFFEILKEEGLQLDLRKLKYFGTITTPETSPIRFSTRFFLAALPENQSPQPDMHEVEEAFWISPEEALSLSGIEEGNILMAPPTILSLKAIVKHQEGIPLMINDAQNKALLNKMKQNNPQVSRKLGF